MQRNRGSQVRVGLLVLVTLVVLATGIFLIGEQNNLFRSKYHYRVRFDNAGGLQAGNPVQLNGINVGRVDSVVLPEDPAEHGLVVTIAVDARYRERVRRDSEARIKTLGLLGDKYVEITSGSKELPRVEDGGEIAAAEVPDVDRLLDTGGDVVDNIVSISVSLKEILSRMERGEGLLGELMQPRGPGDPSLADTLRTLNEAVTTLTTSFSDRHGALGRMLHDRELGEQVATSLGRLDGFTASLESGDGLLPAMINDPEMRRRFDSTLDNLDRATGELAQLTADLKGGDGLLPRLINDEELARELTEELTTLLERLNLATAKLTEGEGTVAKLLDDPSIYEALNDIVVGIDESKLLRWLIRNRQKAGIKKRYKDEKSELEAQGIPFDKP
ncbi:MAG: MCE family protein [Acidobacteria bacterium]|nr:MAG: MCE family protein [Acidobacteriota bacterium]